MSEPTALDWWAVEDAPDVSTTLREADLHCEARYLDEAMRRHQALAARVAALEAAAAYLFRQADFARNGAGEHSPFERLFWCEEKFRAALRPGAPREEGET